MPRPPARERTRDAALQAAGQSAAPYRQAMLRAAQRINPALDEAQWLLQASQILPTRLDLSVLYVPGASHDRVLRVIGPTGVTQWATWEISVTRRE